jgi:hypothetical protein
MPSFKGSYSNGRRPKPRTPFTKRSFSLPKQKQNMINTSQWSTLPRGWRTRKRRGNSLKQLAVQPKEAKKPKLTAMTRPLTAFGVTVTRTKKGGEEVDVTSELIHSERKAMEGLRYHCDNANCDAAFETPKQLANHRRVHNQESK